jgi:hypothetical protein
MPLDERRGRNEALMSKVSHSSAQRFCDTFLSILEEGQPPGAQGEALLTVPQ